MTRERAKELLPIITAFAEGKDVQYRTHRNDVWSPATSPNFAEHLEWRVKPEPREFWVNVYSTGDYCAHDSAESATKARTTGGETIRVREVIDQ